MGSSCNVQPWSLMSEVWAYSEATGRSSLAPLHSHPSNPMHTTTTSVWMPMAIYALTFLSRGCSGNPTTRCWEQVVSIRASVVLTESAATTRPVPALLPSSPSTPRTSPKAVDHQVHQLPAAAAPQRSSSSSLATTMFTINTPSLFKSL